MEKRNPFRLSEKNSVDDIQSLSKRGMRFHAITNKDVFPFSEAERIPLPHSIC